MNKQTKFHEQLESNLSELVERLKSYLNKSYELDQDAILAGWDLSNLVLKEPNALIWTPWAKNIAKSLGEELPKHPAAKVTKMEKWIERETLRILLKYCGQEKTKYEVSKNDPEFDYSYYAVDCWRNFKRGTSLRHLTVDMTSLRVEAFNYFFKKFPKFPSIKGLPFNVFKSLTTLDKVIPAVTPSHDIRTVNLPFMTKHSNVGYPYFKNDQAVKNGKTYAEITLEDARRTKLEDAVHYPYTALTRNLRQKARPIWGSSRILNLLLNRLTAVEVNEYKLKSLVFKAYTNPDELKNSLIKMGNAVKGLRKATGKNYFLFNRDFSHYDVTIRPDFKLWIASFNMTKIVGSKKDVDLGKAIVAARTIPTLKASGVYGYNPKSKPLITLYGRILSGETVTNTDGGKINAMLTLATYYRIDPSYEKVMNSMISKGIPPFQVCGDDNLIITDDLMQERFPSQVEREFGLQVNNDKGEMGVFFLQKRVVDLSTSPSKIQKIVMLTPFTRVIRSMITRENPTGIGAAGWILMAWSVMYQLIEYPDLFLSVARVFIPYDKYELGRKLTIKQLIEMVKLEDSSVKKSRKMTTAEKLQDGDPIKQQIHDEIFSGKESKVLREIHNLLLKA